MEHENKPDQAEMPAGQSELPNPRTNEEKRRDSQIKNIVSQLDAADSTRAEQLRSAFLIEQPNEGIADLENVPIEKSDLVSEVLSDKRPVIDLMPLIAIPNGPVGLWDNCAVIARNNFTHKSLSSWSFNIAVGCGHGCLFCYVVDASTRKQKPKLLEHGVNDPAAQWGKYKLLRIWDEKKFLTSLRKAEETPLGQLNTDGNRAVIFCSTTDAYQVFTHPDSAVQAELNRLLAGMRRQSLVMIRDRSSLNVRILTRGTSARLDFDLFKSFGNRLMFGMSLPTMRNDLARIYEPNAPAPTQRFKTLMAAKSVGIPIYVALAPTYPGCDEADIRATLMKIKELDPLTIFMEPINIRANNVERIRQHAASLGITLNTEVFATGENWQDYAINALKTVERIASELGLADRLHLWPDAALATKAYLARIPDPEAHMRWINKYWNRISEWPR